MCRLTWISGLVTLSGVVLLNSCGDGRSDSYFVGEEEASQLALGYMQTQVQDRLARDVRVLKVVPVVEATGVPAIHVVQFENGGFVLISADRRVPPVVAYSETNPFPLGKDVVGPMGLDGWITGMVEGIASIRRLNPTVVQEAVTQQWELLASEHRIGASQLSRSRSGVTSDCPPWYPDCGCPSTSRTVGPWMSTNWSQGCGYNFYAPTGCSSTTCSKAWTGCVATATGQVMRYNQYPSTYNWSLMPNSVAFMNSGLDLSDFSPGTGDIAVLLRDIGSSVSMDYGCDASSASASDAAYALVYRFGYQSASYQDYNTLTVNQDLNASKPVILDGYDKDCFLFVCYPGDGHMWVTDGYREDTVCYNSCSYCVGYEYLHMNWGWGGQYDGWYNANPDYWTPNGNNFTNWNHMIVGITPPQPKLYFTFDETSGTPQNSGTLTGLAISTAGPITQGVSGYSGLAVQLDSSTDAVIVNDAASLDAYANLTMEGWIYLDALPVSGTYATLGKKESAYMCRLYNSGGTIGLQAVIFNTGIKGDSPPLSPPPVTGTWYHMACTWNGSGTTRELRVYWNGQLVQAVSNLGGNANVQDSSYNLVIGRHQTSGENLVGRIDDFKLWNVTRTDADICHSAGRGWSGTSCN